MNCACNMNQTRPSKSVQSLVALGVVTAPFLGTMLYLRSGGERNAYHKAAASADVPVTDGPEDWSRMAASKLDGSSFAMADLVGEPAVLYFWATWCPQCKVQRDVLNKLAGEWVGRVRTVALAVDDDASAVSRYLEGHARLSHELRASPQLLELFHVEALPTLVVIDRSRAVKAVSVGPMDAERLHSVVEPLLK